MVSVGWASSPWLLSVGETGGKTTWYFQFHPCSVYLTPPRRLVQVKGSKEMNRKHTHTRLNCLQRLNHTWILFLCQADKPKKTGREWTARQANRDMAHQGWAPHSSSNRAVFPNLQRASCSYRWARDSGRIWGVQHEITERDPSEQQAND